MSLGIRGSNPIWVLVNLAGKLFDGSYYLYVLENTLPYIPATVYHDPDLSLPWANPIQFFANGTLPNDIYFEPDTVYRLEFRKNDGVLPPSQNDPLIYEVNNYVPGSGGSTPVDTVAFGSTNQVTNPQFALINFTSSLTLTGATNPPTINVGPGWLLDLVGTGNATITQVPLNDNNQNPSNAPYALELNVSGWDSVILRQRFHQNGMLWANKVVSSTLTARLDGAPQSVSAILVDSNGATLAQVLNDENIDEQWNQVTGHGDLSFSTNPNTPPAAYIEYHLLLPTTVDIYLTSIQLIVQELPFEPTFIQDSIDRQIDYTYHDAYPIVPIGAIIDFGGTVVPAHYLLCNGAPISRTTFRQLFAVIGTTFGVGDGTTTFNLPNTVDRTVVTAGGSLFGGVVGATGGANAYTLLDSDLPVHDHPTTASGNPVITNAGAGSSAFAAGAANFALETLTGGNASVNNPISLVQASILLNKIIRYE